MSRRLAPVLLVAALAGCGGEEERASSTPAGADPADFVAEVDATCGPSGASTGGWTARGRSRHSAERRG